MFQFIQIRYFNFTASNRAVAEGSAPGRTNTAGAAEKEVPGTQDEKFT
jgi:hypothetical protein